MNRFSTIQQKFNILTLRPEPSKKALKKQQKEAEKAAKKAAQKAQNVNNFIIQFSNYCSKNWENNPTFNRSWRQHHLLRKLKTSPSVVMDKWRSSEALSATWTEISSLLRIYRPKLRTRPCGWGEDCIRVEQKVRNLTSLALICHYINFHLCLMICWP